MLYTVIPILKRLFVCLFSPFLLLRDKKSFFFQFIISVGKQSIYKWKSYPQKVEI